MGPRPSVSLHLCTPQRRGRPRQSLTPVPLANHRVHGDLSLIANATVARGGGAQQRPDPREGTQPSEPSCAEASISTLQPSEATPRSPLVIRGRGVLFALGRPGGKRDGPQRVTDRPGRRRPPPGTHGAPMAQRWAENAGKPGESVPVPEWHGSRTREPQPNA